MPDFKIHKPSEVNEDNLTEIISDIYDAINRISKHLETLAKES